MFHPVTFFGLMVRILQYSLSHHHPPGFSNPRHTYAWVFQARSTSWKSRRNKPPMVACGLITTHQSKGQPYKVPCLPHQSAGTSFGDSLNTFLQDRPVSIVSTPLWSLCPRWGPSGISLAVVHSNCQCLWITEPKRWDSSIEAPLARSTNSLSRGILVGIPTLSPDLLYIRRLYKISCVGKDLCMSFLADPTSHPSVRRRVIVHRCNQCHAPAYDIYPTFNDPDTLICAARIIAHLLCSGRIAISPSGRQWIFSVPMALKNLS